MEREGHQIFNTAALLGPDGALVGKGPRSHESDRGRSDANLEFQTAVHVAATANPNRWMDANMLCVQCVDYLPSNNGTKSLDVIVPEGCAYSHLCAREVGDCASNVPGTECGMWW